MRRAYKFRRRYPNRNQERELEIMLETHRRLYNACLGQRKSVYEKDKISVSYGEQSAWFKNQRAVHPWFAKLNFSSAQATMRRLDKAYAAFFRRPRRANSRDIRASKWRAGTTRWSFPPTGMASGSRKNFAFNMWDR